MKTETNPFARRLIQAIRLTYVRRPDLARLVAFGCLSLLSFNLRAQTDDFDNGTATNWLEITSATYPATYSFPADLSGGLAYRLQGIRPAGNIGGANTARVIAYRTNRVYTNFFVAVDILAWGAPNDTNGNIFGIFARGNNLSSGLGNAVMLTVEPNRWYKGQGSSRGWSAVYAFSLSDPESSLPSAVANCTLVEGRAYRLVLTGVSNVFTARIYDLEDLTYPLVSVRGDDRYLGLQFLWPVSGYSGILNVSGASGRDDEDQTTDTTFDNFVAMEFAPTNLVASPGTPHGLPGIAQVVNRSPTSFTNFYPAPAGISFNATTLTTTNTVNTNAIKLFLNGADVSASLSITGPSTNASVAYSGLASNAVYDARIELQDALGRKTTNAWTFDTFGDAYLAGARAKNIEAEDYDFSGGQFIDDPLPSGYATNDLFTPINGDVGYLDRIGASGIDFADAEPGPVAPERDFRFSDSVGTQQGNFGGGRSEGLDLISTIDGDPNDPSGYFPVRLYEVQRQKYASTNLAFHEYLVRHTENGEWLNYTRFFTNSSYYNVYLRHACGSPQYISLDQVAPVTNNLGSFTMPSYTTVLSFRYVPLRDNSGRLAVVNLSGTNTLRLTVPEPYSNAKRFNLALNYMAFIPALLVESSSQVDGTYSIEPSASVEPGTRRVMIPTSNGTRFYRLLWDHQVMITKINLVGGNVELTYQ